MLERETASVQPQAGMAAAIKTPAANSWRWTLRFSRTKPLGAIGGGITIFLVVLAILAPVAAPYGPKETLGRETYTCPPMPASSWAPTMWDATS